MNYRSVSVLPPVSKNLERLIQNQINEHIRNKLSSFLCFIVSKKILDERWFERVVLVDLSKAFDTLNHELLMVLTMNL